LTTETLEGVATPDVELPPLEDDPPLHAVSNVAIAAKPNVNAKAEVRLRLIFMMSPLDKLSDNKFVFMAVCSLPCGSISVGVRFLSALVRICFTI
jgi:hypothetical protein